MKEAPFQSTPFDLENPLKPPEPSVKSNQAKIGSHTFSDPRESLHIKRIIQGKNIIRLGVLCESATARIPRDRYGGFNHAGA